MALDMYGAVPADEKKPKTKDEIPEVVGKLSIEGEGADAVVCIRIPATQLAPERISSSWVDKRTGEARTGMSFKLHAAGVLGSRFVEYKTARQSLLQVRLTEVK